MSLLNYCVYELIQYKAIAQPYELNREKHRQVWSVVLSWI